ncbi:hypothetical protein BDZ94DRAFT_328258 [Collybia nuda]|uniref:Uncharacterized protein n=1 Tax=Collybia nuda TaxID=64659 RepID=A0A9P5YBY2_9AGAR|nr:hypothetical protein BDZ94DRAFT_328258 [Collybia nuda]
MSRNHTEDTWNIELMEANSLLERINGEDLHNPAIIPWIETTLLGFPSTKFSDAATILSDTAYRFGPRNVPLLILYSILLGHHGRIYEAIDQLDVAMSLTKGPRLITTLLVFYRHKIPRLRHIGTGLPPRTFVTPSRLRENWLGLLNLEYGSGLTRSKNLTSAHTPKYPPNLGSRSSEPEETLEDWARRLPIRSASQEAAELAYSYKAASNALQARIWYLDP